ncbi:MAG: hypothetical protein ACRCX2_09610 [Paraclostridium sp.]
MRKLMIGLVVLATITVANACNLDEMEVGRTINEHISLAEEAQIIDNDNAKAKEHYRSAINLYKDIYRHHSDTKEKKDYVIEKIKTLEFLISLIELQEWK